MHVLYTCTNTHANTNDTYYGIKSYKCVHIHNEYIHMYTYTYVIHTCTDVCASNTYTHIHRYTIILTLYTCTYCVDAYLNILTHIHVHTYLQLIITPTYTYIRVVPIRTSMYTSNPCTHTYMRTCVRTRTYIPRVHNHT